MKPVVRRFEAADETVALPRGAFDRVALVSIHRMGAGDDAARDRSS